MGIRFKYANDDQIIPNQTSFHFVKDLLKLID